MVKAETFVCVCICIRVRKRNATHTRLYLCTFLCVSNAKNACSCMHTNDHGQYVCMAFYSECFRLHVHANELVYASYICIYYHVYLAAHS